MAKTFDLSGQRFGRLVAICKEETPSGPKWKCLCDCGEIKYVSGSNLKSGKVKSCGCMKEKLRQKSMTKKAFKGYEKLTVDYIEKRIEYLRDSIKHLKGKTPDMMNKTEYLSYYSAMFRIDELKDLLNKGE